MRKHTFLKVALCCSLILLATLWADVSAQSSSAQSSSARRSRFGLYGDWIVKMSFGERQFESILAFSRDREGSRTGQWISFWGISELQDLKYEDGKLSFSRTSRNREGQSTTSKFTGTIKEGKLTGTISSDRGESKVEGSRAPRMPRAVGNWDMKYKIGDREVTSTLIVKLDKEGKLVAEWQSRRGEHKVTDVQYERGQLALKRTTKIDDREWESTFEGNLERNTLTGTIKSDRGEIAVEGTRIGTPVIGTWNLELVSERGTRKQRLKVNPDMTALYGAMPVKKVNLEDGKVTFKIVMEFGERKFEMNFEGKIAEQDLAREPKLTGELKTSFGTSKVTGKKVVRTFRRRPTQQ